MKLYLLRHATASDIAPSDAARALTNLGREEAQIAGKALAELGAQPTQIISSPLLRARQTAEIAAHELAFKGEVAVFDELENGASLSALLRVLKTFDGTQEFLLVGHMPSLAEHLAVLLNAKTTESLALGKGTVVCVELPELRAGTGELRWFMRQKQLAQVAG